MYGEKALGDSGKTYDVDDDLSTVWYENKARDLYADYAPNDELEVDWVRVVNGFCDSSKTTSLVNVDKKKLKDAIESIVKEREDEIMGESVDPFGFDVLNEHASIVAFPVIEEVIDPVKDAINEGSIERLSTLFKVTEGNLPRSVLVFLREEGIKAPSVPVKAIVPHSMGLRRLDEQALDRIVDRWNNKRNVRNEPLELSWSQDPSETRRIVFNVRIK